MPNYRKVDEFFRKLNFSFYPVEDSPSQDHPDIAGKMTSAPKRNTAGLSKVLVEGYPNAGMYAEDFPNIGRIGGPSTGM